MAVLAGKRCLIVGGTSGIGRAAARRFLQEGARLVVAVAGDRVRLAVEAPPEVLVDREEVHRRRVGAAREVGALPPQANGVSSP